MKMFVNCIVILTWIVIVNSAKILIVVPMPSISHQVVFRQLIHDVIQLDHEVTVLTTDPVYPRGTSPKNLREIDLHDSSYLLWNRMLSTLEETCKTDKLCTLTFFYRVITEVFEEQLKDKSVQKLVSDQTLKFDLLILESCVTPVLIFSHIFKAPVILISSLGANPNVIEMIGGMTHPLIYPHHFHERIYNLTILENINEFRNHVALDRVIENQMIRDDEMLQNFFGINTPPLSELKNNVHMLFLNTHPVWAHNQPVPPSVLFNWGIHKMPSKKLPKDLQSYLDESKNGVIYISFGSNVKPSSIPTEKLKVLTNVVSQLPYDVLWKWDIDELPGKSKNIKISKWFPQTDVLRHPNLKLFITHGGLQSTYEAIVAGVPLIGIPVFADQPYNTEQYVHLNLGIQLNFNSLNSEILENAVRTILKNDSYRENINRLRTQMHDQPIPALENSVRWIEYVLRHGGARHLRTPAANMPWAEYYELELVFLILSALTVLVTGFLLTVWYCFKTFKKNLKFSSTSKIYVNKLKT